MWIRYFPRSGTFPPSVITAVSRYPGVAVRGTVINAPDNAAWLVEQELSIQGVDFDNSISTPDLPSIESVDELVGKGLREWVPGFMTSYQKEGVVAMSGRSGMFFWAPGCLAADTVIAPTGLTIRELYLRRHEGAFPLYASSVDDFDPSYSFRNMITDVVYSGRKEMFEVTITRQARAKNPKIIRRIKATADHGFLVHGPAGPTWMRLGDIVPGAKVYIATDDGHVTKGILRAPKSVGFDHTYDICMLAPFHNFVANGIVVHNSGKTLGAIAWSLCIEGKTVVTTRAPVRRNFAREIERFTTHRAYVVEGTKPIDFTALSDDYRYLVFGHEILPDHVENILKWQPSSFVLDESQRVKSNKRFRATPNEDGTLSFDRLENIAVAAYRISRATRRRLLLTGSPIKDRVRDLWAQLDLAQPEAWGPFYRAGKPSFAGRYCSARPGMYGGIDTTGASNLDELWDRVSLAINQVAYSTTHRDLPPKRRIATFIPPHEQDTTRGFEKIFEAADKKGKTNAVEARLMEAAARKRSYLMGLLEEAVENKQKVVVFTGRREDCDRLIREATKKFGKVAEVIGAHGGHPSAYRDELQQKYMATEDSMILIGTGDAWGEGVNLHSTDLFIITMLPYTPGQIIQWEGRVCRQGQKRPVMIQYLIAEGTVDEHVASLLSDKLPAVETVARDESITGLSDSLLGLDNEEALIDSILGKIGDVVVTEDDD